MNRPRAFVLGALLLAGCGVRHQIQLYAELQPLAGQSVEQKQFDLNDCTQRGANFADQIVSAAAGRALGNALANALVGAATGAAVGAAFGNAGYGAKVGTASWGTPAAMAGALTQPDWYAVAYEAAGVCLVQRGYVVQSLVRVQ